MLDAPAIPTLRWPDEAHERSVACWDCGVHNTPRRCWNCGSEMIVPDPPHDARCLLCTRTVCTYTTNGKTAGLTGTRQRRGARCTDCDERAPYGKQLRCGPCEYRMRVARQPLCPDCGQRRLSPQRERCRACATAHQKLRALPRQLVERLAVAEDGGLRRETLWAMLGVNDTSLRQAVHLARVAGYVIVSDKQTRSYRLLRAEVAS